MANASVPNLVQIELLGG